MIKPEIPAQDMLTLDALQEHPQNYKVHPKSQVLRVMASLREHGQRKPVPVRKTASGVVIIAGHCVVTALGELAKENLAKWGHCWVTYTPDDWTDEKAINYLIADNKTSEGAEDDQQQLYEMLTRQQEAGFSIESMGTTSAEYAKLFDELQKDSVKTQPDVPFAVGLMESYNYVVLFFTNDIDWLFVQTLYPLPQIQKTSSVGRVVDGIDFIRKIQHER